MGKMYHESKDISKPRSCEDNIPCPERSSEQDIFPVLEAPIGEFAVMVRAWEELNFGSSISEGWGGPEPQGAASLPQGVGASDSFLQVVSQLKQKTYKIDKIEEKNNEGTSMK